MGVAWIALPYVFFNMWNLHNIFALILSLNPPTPSYMTMPSFNRIKIWSVLVFLHYKKYPRHMIQSIPLKTLDRGEQATASQPPAAASPPPSPPCPPCRPELVAPQTASPPDLIFQQSTTKYLISTTSSWSTSLWKVSLLPPARQSSLCSSSGKFRKVNRDLTWGKL